MPYRDDFSKESHGLELLATIYAIRSQDKCIQTQRTCNFCITKVLNALTDDIPYEISMSILEDVESIMCALSEDL